MIEKLKEIQKGVKICKKSAVEHAGITYMMWIWISFAIVWNLMDMENTPCFGIAVNAGRKKVMSKSRASKQNGIRAQLGKYPRRRCDVYKNIKPKKK